MTEQEISHLEWIYRMLLHVEHHSEDDEYMRKFKEIIEKYKDNKPVTLTL